MAPRWTDEDKITVFALHGHGNRPGVIAPLIGRTDLAVQALLYTHKKSLRPQSAPSNPKPPSATVAVRTQAQPVHSTIYVPSLRYTADGLRAIRGRLGLSVPDMAALYRTVTGGRCKNFVWKGWEDGALAIPSSCDRRMQLLENLANGKPGKHSKEA